MWNPTELKHGDVVTAAAVGRDANVFRIFVNGTLVAEEGLDVCKMPDPALAQLWGIVDADGACPQVRFGNQSGEEFPDTMQDPASPLWTGSPKWQPTLVNFGSP